MRPSSDGQGRADQVDRLREGGRSPRRRATTPVIGAFLFALIAAACSSSPKSPGVAGGDRPSTTAQAGRAGSPSSDALAQMMAYAKCMRGHGIADFPDPTPNPGGPGGSFNFNATGDLSPTSSAYQSANRACQALLPNGGQIRAPSAKRLAAEVRLAACMRTHGVPEFPDPNGQGAFNLGEVDKGTPQFSSAD